MSAQQHLDRYPGMDSGLKFLEGGTFEDMLLDNERRDHKLVLDPQVGIRDKHSFQNKYKSCSHTSSVVSL